MTRLEIIDKWNGMTDRERDAWVHEVKVGKNIPLHPYENLGNYDVHNFNEIKPGERFWVDPFTNKAREIEHYTTSWHESGSMFEELGEGYCLTRRTGKNRWHMMDLREDLRFYKGEDAKIHAVVDDIQPTPQRAICLAYLLKKLEAEDTDNA